jgi:hypothetical protein
MPILLAGTIEFVNIEQVSAFFTFRLGQVLLYHNSGHCPSHCLLFKIHFGDGILFAFSGRIYSDGPKINLILKCVLAKAVTFICY